MAICKKLMVYVRYLNNDGPTIEYLQNLDVPDGTAKTIAESLRKLMVQWELPFSKVTSLATDGASVMTGSVADVGKLLQKYNPVMIQIHCVAHRLALAAVQATKAVTSFNEYQRYLKLVYRF